MVLSEHGLSCFRTKACNNYATGQCQFTESKCIYSHNEICIRRCPYYLSDISYIRYIPMFCKDVVLGPDFKVVECKCNHGNECIYSHCLDELLYHPQFYKVQECQEFTQGNCTRAFCPFYHSQDEKRTLKHYKLPFCKGMDVPPIKYITMVDKIGKVKPDAESLVKKRRRKRTHAQHLDGCGVDSADGITSNNEIEKIPSCDDIHDIAADLRSAQQRINAQIDAVGGVSSSGILQHLIAADSACPSPMPQSLMSSPLVNKPKVVHDMYSDSFSNLELDEYNELGDDDKNDVVPYITRSSTIERDFVQMSSHLEEFTNETKQTLYRNIKGLLESPKMQALDLDEGVLGSSPTCYEDVQPLQQLQQTRVPQHLLYQYNAILQHNNYYIDGFGYDYD